MDPESISAARKERAAQALESQYSTFTADDISEIKAQISAVLAETIKAAVEMSVHFQVR